VILEVSALSPEGGYVLGENFAFPGDVIGVSPSEMLVLGG
jgi:hypothetical protein